MNGPFPFAREFSRELCHHSGGCTGAYGVWSGSQENPGGGWAGDQEQQQRVPLQGDSWAPASEALACCFEQPDSAPNDKDDPGKLLPLCVLLSAEWWLAPTELV